MRAVSNLYDKMTKYDFALIFLALGIVIIGVINLYSATHTSAFEGSAAFFRNQIIFACVGIVMMVVFIVIDYRNLERFAYIAYIVNILLLVAVLVLGHSASGARRWLSLGFMKFQPSEFMKLTMVWALVRFFNSDRNLNGYTLQELTIPFAMVGLPALLIIAQPDLGTAMMHVLVGFTIFLFVGIQKRSLITLITIAVISVPVVYSFVLKDYQKKRVLTFIDPSRDPKGSGYNSLQSKIAVGSGQFFGKGFMKGTQTQLNFLPEHHTDFIFSVFGEEHGFLGAGFLVLLYTLLFYAGVRISSKARDKLGALLAMGCVAILFWHAFINMGMVIGVMPVVGVTLPFMSYGGTSIILNFILIGFIQNVAVRRFMF